MRVGAAPAEHRIGCEAGERRSGEIAGVDDGAVDGETAQDAVGAQTKSTIRVFRKGAEDRCERVGMAFQRSVFMVGRRGCEALQAKSVACWC